MKNVEAYNIADLREIARRTSTTALNREYLILPPALAAALSAPRVSLKLLDTAKIAAEH